jgi:hypothetical protein
MQSKVLIVTGMHRSGTSLITNWLYHCGLQVGECLVGASQSNEEGHYEDIEFLRIHEEILTGNGYPPSGLIHHKSVHISEYQFEKLKAILRVKQQRFDQWGWKEPRTCLFLDVYRELIPGAKYLVIMREYAAVVNSLLKRDFDIIDNGYAYRGLFTRLKWKLLKKDSNRKKYYREKATDYLQVWIDYNEHILDMLTSIPKDDYLVINYSLLETRDRDVFAFLTKAWDFKLEHFPFVKVYKKNMISAKNDIDPLIEDQALIFKAKELEGKFKNYMRIA